MRRLLLGLYKCHILSKDSGREDILLFTYCVCAFLAQVCGVYASACPVVLEAVTSHFPSATEVQSSRAKTAAGVTGTRAHTQHTHTQPATYSASQGIAPFSAPVMHAVLHGGMIGVCVCVCVCHHVPLIVSQALPPFGLATPTCSTSASC